MKNLSVKSSFFRNILHTTHTSLPTSYTILIHFIPEYTKSPHAAYPGRQSSLKETHSVVESNSCLSIDTRTHVYGDVNTSLVPWTALDLCGSLLVQRLVDRPRAGLAEPERKESCSLQGMKRGLPMESRYNSCPWNGLQRLQLNIWKVYTEECSSNSATFPQNVQSVARLHAPGISERRSNY